MNGSHDQKGRSRRRKINNTRQSQDISDQKLPSDSGDTTLRSSIDQKGDTNEMLKNILKHETQNSECLKELV